MKEIRIIESALFSAGTPLGMDELKAVTSFDEQVIKDALDELMIEYKNLGTSIEVVKVGEKFAMQLRPEFAEYVRKIAVMEIPAKVLKTAALIAYHQPIKQSELLKMEGYKVYDHVKTLEELGLIHSRELGRTKALTTSSRFSEYFGISTTDREGIKKWLMEKLNIKISADGKLDQQEQDDKKPEGESGGKTGSDLEKDDEEKQ